jgi:hypothetical protein
MAEGEPHARIAGKYGLSRSCVQRHSSHLSAALEVAERAVAGSALDHATWLVTKLRRIAEDDLKEGERKRFLWAADTLNRAVLTLGRITGEVSPAVNVFFVKLGASEQDLVAAWDFYKSVRRERSLEEQREDGVALLKLVLARRPDWLYLVRTALEAACEEAEVVVDTAPPELPAATNGAHTNGA